MFAKNALVLAVGALTGCVAPVAGSAPLAGGAPARPAAASHAAGHVDENLARLRALDVFTVGQLVVDVPAGSGFCYGPCPGAEAAIAAAKTKSATRLARLAAAAEKAAASPLPDACAQPVIDRNLAALAALRIVRVSGLIVTQPSNNPQCNDTPCPADRARSRRCGCCRFGHLRAGRQARLHRRGGQGALSTGRRYGAGARVAVRGARLFRDVFGRMTNPVTAPSSSRRTEIIP